MMKSTKTLFVATVTLALGASALQAQYFDAVDWLQHPDAGTSPNLFVATNGAPLLATTADGTPEWRYRNTGPGPKAWGGNAYQIRLAEGDVAGRMDVTGLSPNTDYWLIAYAVYPQNSTNAVPSTRGKYGAEFSVDGGVSYTRIDNQTLNLDNLYWVDNSSPLGAPLPTTSGDTRAYSYVREFTSDGTGNLSVYIKLPATLSSGQGTDRFILDGLAFAVPEPTTFALAGLGAAALLIFRRRS